MRGQYIDTMMQGSYRAYIESLYNRLVDQRSPIYSVSTYDQRLLHTKRLMLPLSSDGQQVDMVLSAQVFIRSAGPPNTVQIGREHVCTPVTNEHPVCSLLLDKQN